jgi:hypothetical protein
MGLLRFQCSIHGDDRGSPLAVTFDDALAALAALPRMFIEPDGSFVWRGADAGGTPSGNIAWQLDGNLIDRGDVLAYVDLKGTCPLERLEEVLAAVGWLHSPLAFQLPRKGQFLTEEAFRRQAATPEGAG